MKWEHDRQTLFLEELIARTERTEGSSLLKRLSQARQEEHCLRRAVLLVSLLLLASVVGYGYVALLWADQQNPSPEMLMQCVSGLGLASLLSVIAFLAGWVRYRKDFNKLHQESRNFVLEHLGLGRRG